MVIARCCRPRYEIANGKESDNYIVPNTAQVDIYEALIEVIITVNSGKARKDQSVSDGARDITVYVSALVLTA